MVAIVLSAMACALAGVAAAFCISNKMELRQQTLVLREMRSEQTAYKKEIVATVRLLALRSKEAIPKPGNRQAHLAIMRAARGA